MQTALRRRRRKEEEEKEEEEEEEDMQTALWRRGGGRGGGEEEEEALAVCLPRERAAASGSDRGHCCPGWLFSAGWLKGQLPLADWLAP